MRGLTIWREPGTTKQREVIGYLCDGVRKGRIQREGQRVLVSDPGGDWAQKCATIELSRRTFNEEVAQLLEREAPAQAWTHTQVMMITGLSKQGVNKVARMGRKRLGSRPDYSEGYRYTTREVAMILRREVRNTPRLALMAPVSAEGMRKALEDRGDQLTSAQRRAVEVRYGLDGQGVRSLSEAANELKITRQGVSQAERRAVEHLFPGKHGG